MSKEHKENFWGDTNRPDDGDGDRTTYILSGLIELCTYKQQILLCNSRAQTKNNKKRKKSCSLMLLIQIQPLNQIMSFRLSSTL